MKSGTTGDNKAAKKRQATAAFFFLFSVAGDPNRRKKPAFTPKNGLNPVYVK
jgi:hypothetical protein